MRKDLPEGAKKIEDADCGCERYEIPTQDALGKTLSGVVALHTCVKEEPKRARSNRK